MWWLIVTIVVCTYFIIKVIREQSPEGQNKKIAKLIDSAEVSVKYWNEQIQHREPDLVEADLLDNLRADFSKMEDGYNRFKNREVDLKRVLDFATGLGEYGDTLHSLKMAWCSFQVDMSHEAVNKYSSKRTELDPRKEALEDKFRYMMHG